VRRAEPFLLTLTLVYVVVLLAGRLLAFVVAAMGAR
jgi:hypothetical protein